MRALVYSVLARGKAQDDVLSGILDDDTQSAAEAMARARADLDGTYRGRPRVLDMFGGGGTIAIESARFGADVVTIDTNQLSLFIQRSLLHDARLLDRDAIGARLRDSGNRVLKRVAEATGPLFPLRRTSSSLGFPEGPVAYLWTWAIRCESCDYRHFLSRRPWLSSKKSTGLRLSAADSDDGQQLVLEEVSRSTRQMKQPNSRRRSTRCPRCGIASPKLDVRTLEELLVAIGSMKTKGGKKFELAPRNALPGEGVLAAEETRLLHDLGVGLPESLMPVWSGVVNPPLHGIVGHGDLLNRRQRLVALNVIRALREEHARLIDSCGGDVAVAVVSLLSGLVDQCVDWNCRLSMWISQNEQVGRALSGPGIAMLWDYCEVDPVLDGPANLWSKLDRIVSGAEACVGSHGVATILRADSTRLPLRSSSIDAVITDPPYYDNVYYSHLADCIYAWKRLLLKPILPGLFSGATTSSAHELVASRKRSGSTDAAHFDYCERLARAVNEASRVLRPRGRIALVYSHGSLRGWDALLHAYRSASLFIEAVHPMRVERKHRPRGMRSKAVNTCVVFVARKKDSARSTLTVASLRNIVSRFVVSRASESGAAGEWEPMDLGIAAFAKGLATLANSSSLVDSNTTLHEIRVLEALVRLNWPSFRLLDRAPL